MVRLDEIHVARGDLFKPTMHEVTDVYHLKQQPSIFKSPQDTVWIRPALYNAVGAIKLILILIIQNTHTL